MRFIIDNLFNPKKIQKRKKKKKRALRDQKQPSWLRKEKNDFEVKNRKKKPGSRF